MTAAADPPALRLATFNVENLGAGGAAGPGVEERIRVLRPQLTRLRADILCLQEVDSQKGDNGRERLLSVLDAVLDRTPYAHYRRAVTVSRSTGRFRDKHNLVTLSRLPIEATRQVMHDFVAPPRHVSPLTREGDAVAAEWDRPILHTAVRVDGSRLLHVVNVHLRATRAAFIAGEKEDSHTWRSMAGWAEGFYLAAIKQAGQALETRLFVESLFDADPEALIVVCGDFNADMHEIPLRTIRGDEEDAGNPLLASRTLVPLERSLAGSRRYSVIHHGRPQMLDHVLISRRLLAWYRTCEVHNEALGDELVTAHAVHATPESFHAPVVAEFAFADAAPTG